MLGKDCSERQAKIIQNVDQKCALNVEKILFRTMSKTAQKAVLTMSKNYSEDRANISQNTEQKLFEKKF